MEDHIIVEDNENNNTFLNCEKLEILKNVVNKCKERLEYLYKTGAKKKLINSTIRDYFTFEKIFNVRGVQGIAGLLTVNNKHIKSSSSSNGKTNDLGRSSSGKANKKRDTKREKEDKPVQIVFKLATGINKTIEHEYLVGNSLNSMRNYCPHFLGNLGMITIPISQEFLENPEEMDLFYMGGEGETYFHNILLTEYVSPISFYHVCKYMNDDRSVIMSQLCSILTSIDMAQEEHKLTQYDLHLDNILIRPCEQNSIFFYRNKKGDNILLHSFGYYPLIIDFGSSYIDSVEGKYMYTSIDNYHNGLQPVLYDNLNDIHHLLLSCLYYLESKGKVYEHMRYYFMSKLKNIPILSKRGWKQLPVDISDSILDIIEDRNLTMMIGKNNDDGNNRNNRVIESVEDFSVYEDYKIEILEIINFLIILPWNKVIEIETESKVDNETDNETREKSTDLENQDEYKQKERKKLFHLFFEAVEILEKIYNFVDNSENILYFLRDVVDCINEQREKTGEINDNKIIEKIIEKIEEKTRGLLRGKFRKLEKIINFNSLIKLLLQISTILSSIYHNLCLENVNIINKCYIETDMKSPVDAVKILLQNATPRIPINRESKFYLFDSNKKEKKVFLLEEKCRECGIDIEKLIYELDNIPILEKGNFIVNNYPSLLF